MAIGNARLYSGIPDIDETLWLIPDPAKRELGKDEINYPEVGLDNIDLEWRMNNVLDLAYR